MSQPLIGQAIQIPDWAWQRQETRALLRERDVAGLFAFARSYGGASQARIAAATGVSQPRVNEIMHRRRAVSSIDVLERIAAGFHMPDDARIAMGLAPRRFGADDLPPLPGELSEVYASQQPVADELRRQAHEAKELDVLAVRALGLVGLNNSLLRPALIARETPLQVRALLLDPDSPVASRRALEIGESVGSFTAGIRLTVARLHEVAENPALQLTVKLYARLPVWRLIRLDEVLYVSAFDAAGEGHESAVHKIPRTPRGAFWAGYRRSFEDLWSNAAPVIGDAG